MSVPLERKSSSAMDPHCVDDAGLPKVMAVLNATGKKDKSTFSDTDLKALSILANHAAAALENVRLIRDIEENQREVVYTLGEIVETRSKETGQHVKRVAEYSRFLALRSGLLAAEAEVLRMASPLHDVGKVGIPNRILLKPGRLTPEEFDIMKTHAAIGRDSIETAERLVSMPDSFLRFAKEIAGSHHEKWDGSGYPKGLAGEAIPLAARLMALADVYDALISKRVYKEAFSHEMARDIIVQGRGTHFDPEVVDAFIALEQDFIDIAKRFSDDENDQRRNPAAIAQ